MNSVFLENSYIESVISGLKNLYEELVIDEKEKELVQGETRVKWFENERNKAMTSLKELFIKEQETLIQKRIWMNAERVVLFKKFTWVFIVQHILCYLELDEILKLTGVCVYFNCLIKSTFFIKYIVTTWERTKIDISLDAFSAGNVSHDSVAAKFGQKKKIKQDQHQGDLQA